jgi:thioredoxin-related protein
LATTLALALLLTLVILGTSSNLAADEFPTQKQLDLGLKPVDYQPALESAKTDKKMVLLYFWAVWCGNCQIFSENVLSDPAIIGNINKDFEFVSIDIDKDKPMAESFQVRAVPTIIFMESDGKPVSVLPGAIPGQIFTLVLSYMSGGFYKDMEFVEYFDSLNKNQPGRPDATSPPANAGAGQPASGLGLEAAGLIRSAYLKAQDPINQYLAICMVHMTLQGFTTQSYWAGLTLLSKKLFNPGENDWTVLSDSNPFQDKDTSTN